MLQPAAPLATRYRYVPGDFRDPHVHTHRHRRLGLERGIIRNNLAAHDAREAQRWPEVAAKPAAGAIEALGAIASAVMRRRTERCRERLRVRAGARARRWDQCERQ